MLIKQIVIYLQKKNSIFIHMRHKNLFTFALLLIVSCTSHKKDSSGSNVIDVVGGLQNITMLKTSDFGKTIRYIPLETTDDCLIGNNPIVKVLKNHIIVEVNRRCLLFDKKNGNFISEIGHIGQDPEAYSSSFSWTDEKEEFLYFTSAPDKLLKYDMQGNFAGKIEIPSPPGPAAYYLVTNSEIIGYYNGINSSGNYTLAFLDKTGTFTDTIPSLLTKPEETTADIINISVTKGNTVYGNWTKTGAIIINYKNDKKQIIAADATTLWNYNGNYRFKENFVDTIYTISGRELIPSITFKTGKWQWPENERLSKNNNSERVFISDVSENNTFVFFQCIKGLYTDDPILYNGLYNKKTGETQLGKNSDSVHDDLTGFIPFKPYSISTSGEFVSFVEAIDIIEWIEKHPEFKNNAKLTFLQNFNDDMNPVIVLVE